jgi:anti-sigma B factor antagonist
MALSIQAEQGIVVVTIVGDLDEVHAAELNQALDQLWTDGQRYFVLDLGQVKFIDSAGLAALVRCFKRVQSSMGQVLLAALQPEVQRVFTLTRLDRAFEICPDVAAAMQHRKGP